MKNTEMEWLLLKSAPEPRMFQSAVSTAQVEKFGFLEDRKTRYKKWGEETYFDAHYYKLNLE